MNSWMNPYVKTERNPKWSRKWSPEWRSKWNPKRNCKWHLHQSITMRFFFHGVCLPEKPQFDFSPRRFSFIVVYSKSPKRMETRTYLPIKMMFLSHGGFPTDHIHGFNFGWNMQVSLLQEFPIVFLTYLLVPVYIRSKRWETWTQVVLHHLRSTFLVLCRMHASNKNKTTTL